MANPEHLAKLKEGVAAWNQWRKGQQEVTPDLAGVDLAGAHLAFAGLAGANLTLAGLAGAHLAGADLVGACLAGAQLYGADLTAANLARAYLVGANLYEANLTGAQLVGAHVTGVNLAGANFSDAVVAVTSLSNVDLSQAKGLGSVIHEFPSSIGVDTLTRTLRGSGGRFTEEQVEFFLGAGVPETLLDNLPGMLETSPIQFYKCCVSYSTLNEAFATPLNQDLKQAGVKTWKWDRDAVRGRDLAQSIDWAIRSHEKTILICSVNSLTSPQVEREIQTALDKEAQIKNANAERRREALAKGELQPQVDADVLLPIRIDDTIFRWDSHLKGEVTRRMVADFTNAPPGGEKYQRELQQLIKALNPKSWPPGVKRPSQ